MKKGQRKGMLLLAAALCAGSLSGCAGGVSLPGSVKSEKGYSTAQIQMIASTEKNRYEALCSEELWQVELGTDGETFEGYIKAQLHSFMDEMKVMNLLAAEKGISATQQEQAAMAEAAAEYYGLLSAEDIARMELTLEEVQSLYMDYCVAEKLVTELTGDMSLEVSDSEAKVITLLQAEAETQAEADAFLAAATEDGTNFLRCAEEYGLVVTERTLGRKEEAAAYEDAVFSLETEEISPVLSVNGTYYVVKCTNSYDREKTAERKMQIYEERRQKAFQDLYQSYREELRIVYSGDPFEKLDMQTISCEKEADFFEIYKKYAAANGS